MPKLAELPDGTRVEFPDDATTEEITAAVNNTTGVISDPSFGERVQSTIDEVAPFAGALFGGAGGAMLGAGAGGVGAVPGALIGAGTGAAAGKQLGEVTRPFLTGRSTPLSEQLTETAKTGLTAAAGEASGMIIAKSIQKLLAPFAGRLESTVEAAKKAAPGLVLTPAQATQTRVLDILENISEASLLGGGRIQGFKANQQDVIKRAASELAERFGQQASPDEVGLLFKGAVQKSREAFGVTAKSLYGEVDQLVGNQSIVDMRVVKGFAVEKLAKQGEIPKALSSRIGRQLLDQLGKLPDRITFGNAQLIRSQLLKAIRSVELDDIEKGLSKKVASSIDEAMSNAANQLSPDALTAYRTANQFYREGVEQFHNQFIRALMKKNPEKVAESIFRPGGITLVRQAKATVDEPVFDQLRGAVARKVFQESLDQNGQLIGSTLQRKLFGKTGLGVEVLDETFSPPVRKELANLTDALHLTQRRPSEGTGRVFIQLAQASAGVELLFNPVESITGISTKPATVAIVLGPAAVGRLFTNPRAIHWLTEGIRLGPTTAAGIRALTQFSALSMHPQALPTAPIRINPVPMGAAQ